MASPLFLDAVIGARIVAETVRALIFDVSPTISDLEVTAQVSCLDVTEHLEWKPLVMPMATEGTTVLVLCGVTPADSPNDGPTRDERVVFRRAWDGKSQYVTLRNGTQTVTTMILRQET